MATTSLTPALSWRERESSGPLPEWPLVGTKSARSSCGGEVGRWAFETCTSSKEATVGVARTLEGHFQGRRKCGSEDLLVVLHRLDDVLGGVLGCSFRADLGICPALLHQLLVHGEG